MSMRDERRRDDIDLMSVFGALRRALPKILIASVLMGALAYGVMSLLAPRYMSETQLAVVSKRTNPFPETGNLAPTSEVVAPRLDREAINTHVKALTAPELLLSVADKLKLAERAEFNPAIGPSDTLDEWLRQIGLRRPNPEANITDVMYAKIDTRLQVAAARETRFISIKFSSADPQLAARFANTLAESYRRGLVEVPVEETNAVVLALMPKIEQLNDEVVRAEAELERFRAETNRLLTGPQQVPLNSQRLNALSDELAAAESARRQAEARWRTAQALLDSDSAEVLPEVQASNTIQGLINQRVRLERQINEASAALLPAHPRMRQLNADLRGLRLALNAEVRKVVQSLEKVAQAAKLRVDDIARQMTQLKTQVVNTSGDDARIRVLEAAANSKRTELERLRRQLEDNRTLVVTRSVPVEAQIISQARPTSTPAFPKKGPISALVMAATLLFGLALTAAREIVAGSQGPLERQPMRDTHRPQAARREAPEEPKSSRDAEPPAAEPPAAPQRSAAAMAGAAAVLAATPVPEPRPDQDDTLDHDQLQAIAGHIAAQSEPTGGHRTIVVGDAADLDVAAEALGLARQLGGAGRRVILVDASKDGVGILGGGQRGGGPGLSDLIAGDAGFEEVVDVVPQSEELHLLGPGRPLADGDQHAADHANLVLDALDEAYDHIVVTGHYAGARDLFEIVQGRFDTAVTVTTGDVADRSPSADTFLGFEVRDIDMQVYGRPSRGSRLQPVEQGATGLQPAE